MLTVTDLLLRGIWMSQLTEATWVRRILLRHIVSRWTGARCKCNQCDCMVRRPAAASTW